MEFPRVSEVRALDPWRLWVKFTDGSTGEVDLADLAGKGVFAAWNDERVWRSVTTGYGGRSIVWPGDIDLCPDLVYHKITGAPLPGQAPRSGYEAA